MRKVICINDAWDFTKESVTEKVDLPHTWNAVDGQSEKNYYRGKCSYKKKIGRFDGGVILEINGANTRCEVFVNGTFVGEHINGYSTFRFDITKLLTKDENELLITVDNSSDPLLYPQVADFTFYGGLYRDVNIISGLSETHFSLLDKSRNGVYITPRMNGDVYIKSFVEGSTDGITKEFEILDKDGNVVASAQTDASKCISKMHVDSPVLWNGVENPYLYTLHARLKKDGEIIDEVEDTFGFREFSFDAEKGFFLNGKHLKLKGVSRHQDREFMGNALTEKEHKEDVKLICEVGANSVRLAHYQHDEKFYKECDRAGLLVWAEIPVISSFSKKKQPQARLMLEELIRQNYNHPCIFCWGVSNEISIASPSRSLFNGIKELNDIAKKLDCTRPTACAQVTFSSMTSKLNYITDILGYNQYFGWYVQTADQIGVWLDKFHTVNPQIKLCLSEYGAEGITTLHSQIPLQGDYSEEYQALFHEKYLKAINERDWLWGSYVWNMFDFGSAIRNEGGVRGRNNKGLVTIDRKIKKDAFWIYKAYWSDEKFVHITGERYVDRPKGVQKIKVYSNCNKVKLTVNGEEQVLEGDKIFTFTAEIKEGENVIKASSGRVKHEIKVNGTEKENESYSLGENNDSFVRNWFEASDTLDPQRLSLNDSLGTILGNTEIQKIMKSQAGRVFTVPKPLGKISLKPIVKVAEKTKKGNELVGLANQYLQSIKKE